MTVSFFHWGDAQMASYRYRCQIPAKELGASINDDSADVWIMAKPHEKTELPQNKTILVDICDEHFGRPSYQSMIRSANLVTCSTPYLANLIREDFGIEAIIIPDPYEYPEHPPHVAGTRCLWFGHPKNYYSIERWLPFLSDYELHLVSDYRIADRVIQWSPEVMHRELECWADLVLLPSTAPYKSPNRCLEAIRSGCFVVAEPHPSLQEFDGLYIGNLQKGIEWVRTHRQEANQRVTRLQAYIRDLYSPAHVANAWRTAIQGCVSKSAADTSPGKAGSMSMAPEPVAMPMS